MTRDERHAARRAKRLADAERIRQLADRGLNGLRIAERLGLSRGYTYELLTDPTGEKSRERRERYTGKCADCGSRTYNGNAVPPERCYPCAMRHSRIWTRETIIDAVQAWVQENGSPPVASDWNPNQARALGHPEKSEKFYAENAWPSVTQVQERFGSWNAAIAAAGFTPRKPGEYPRPVNTEAFFEAVALADRGLPIREIARQIGVSGTTIRRWIAEAGQRLAA